jgi:hypothetical protein
MPSIVLGSGAYTYARGSATITSEYRTGTLLWGGALLLLGGVFIATSGSLRGRRSPTGRLVLSSGVACGVRRWSSSLLCSPQGRVYEHP